MNATEESRPASKGGQSQTVTENRPKASTKDKDAGADGQAELATAIDELLDTVGSKFKTMSKDIMAQSKSCDMIMESIVLPVYSGFNGCKIGWAGGTSKVKHAKRYEPW